MNRGMMGVPEDPGNLEVQKRGQKSNRYSITINNPPGYEKLTTALTQSCAQKPPRHSCGRLRRRHGRWRGARSSEFDVVAVSDEARLLLKLKSEKFSLKTFLDAGQSLASSRNQFFVS